jgi:hypothetical protein
LVFAGGGGGGGGPTGFSVNNISILEGSSGGFVATATVSVILSGVSAGSYTVDYATSDVTADSSDYISTSGTLTFSGNGTQVIEVPINGDTDHESNETFTITLSNAVGTTILSDTATVTIINDDITVYEASNVLGQFDGSNNPEYTTDTSGTTVKRFSNPSDLALDLVHHRLFVADASNNRVLEFNLDSSNTLIDNSADHVLGQSTMTVQVATAQFAAGYTISQSGLLLTQVAKRLFWVRVAKMVLRCLRSSTVERVLQRRRWQA